MLDVTFTSGTTARLAISLRLNKPLSNTQAATLSSLPVARVRLASGLAARVSRLMPHGLTSEEGSPAQVVKVDAGHSQAEQAARKHARTVEANPPKRKASSSNPTAPTSLKQKGPSSKAGHRTPAYDRHQTPPRHGLTSQLGEKSDGGSMPQGAQPKPGRRSSDKPTKKQVARRSHQGVGHVQELRNQPRTPPRQPTRPNSDAAPGGARTRVAARRGGRAAAKVSQVVQGSGRNARVRRSRVPLLVLPDSPNLSSLTAAETKTETASRSGVGPKTF